MNSRRMVLGSMVTVAGAGSAALIAQTRGMAAAQAVPAPGASELVLEEIKEQMKAALAGLQRGSADAARRAVALVQVWAAHVYAQTPHSELLALAQRAVRRQGRDAILQGPASHADIEANLRALGLTTVDIAQLDLHAPIDPAAREAALTRVLATGVQPSVDRAVTLLTYTAERLETRGGLRPVAARQDGCADICLAPDLFKAEMEVFCALAALAAIYPPMLVFAEVCALFAGFWLSALAMCSICHIFG